MRYQGKIFSWKDDQGFGFVTPNGGGDRAFVHIKAFSTRYRRPVDGDLITYELVKDRQGRTAAADIRFVDQPGESKGFKPRSAWDIRLALVAVLVLPAANLAGWLPSVVVKAYLALSIVTFVFYAIDKSAARQGAWRTPEKTLHLLALVGGWPGAALAQRLLRHKSVKKEFLWVYWATILANCAFLGWLVTPAGASFIRQITG